MRVIKPSNRFKSQEHINKVRKVIQIITAKYYINHVHNMIPKFKEWDLMGRLSHTPKK